MKSVVLIFKGGTWKVVDCEDFQVQFNDIGEVVNITWQKYEEQPLPYYINYSEIIGIFQSGKKKSLQLELQAI